MKRSRAYQAVLLFCALCIFQTAARAQSSDRAHLVAEIVALHNQLKEKEVALLAPAPEDRAAFAEVLTQPDSGLIRLLPREKYNGKLSITGGGAYYSFSLLTQEYGGGSDIELQQGKLSVGFAGADFGYLLMLGDQSLETVNMETAGVPFLAKLVTPSTEPEAREQQRQMYEGINSNGFTYRRTVPALVDRTYIVRSVGYRTSDILVAFRVVRQDTDGSLILLWKTLKKYPVPHLAN